MILDTARYVFRPQAEQDHPLPLSDATVYARHAGSSDDTPIAFRAVLEGGNGERVHSGRGGYGIREQGEELCLGWTNFHPGVTYVRLRLWSTRPVVLDKVTWRYLTRD
jgi:hypothetical protein